MKIHAPPEKQPLVRSLLDDSHTTVIVKENAARVVRRVAPKEGPAYFVKEFRERSLAGRLRRLVADRARHEYRILERLREAGVGAAVPVAWGVRGTRSFLVTEEIAGARVLRDEVERPSTPSDRRLFLKALGAFVRSIHDAGVRDDDLHLGNILLTGTLGWPNLFLIDVHRAVIDRDVSRAERCAGLGFLLHSMQSFFGLSDRIRLLRAYWGSEYSRAVALDVRHEFDEARERYARSRAARATETGTAFVAKGGTYLRRPLELAQARQLLNTPPLREVKAVGRRRLWLIDASRFVREDPRAAAIWRNAHALDVRGIATPRLWACEGSRVMGEWIPDAEPLNEFLERRLPGWRPSRRREFGFRLARFVRSLHEAGAFHHDLKANNVLVRGDGEGWQFLVIDVDRVTFTREVPRDRRIFNLAQLNAALGGAVTVGDRLAFYRAYAGRRKDWLRDERGRVRAIMKATRARRHRWPPNY